MKARRFTEKEVRSKLAEHCANYGAMTIGEAKAIFRSEEKMTYTDMETIPSSATTCRYEKTIGNIVSHQVEPIQYYEEGFICDKTIRPAVFEYAVGPNQLSLGTYARLRNRSKRMSK